MNIPKSKITQKDISKIKETDELELVPMVLSKLLLSNQDGSVAVLEADDKAFTYALDSYEGTQLSFANAGLSDHSHIKTIYQLFLGWLRDQEVKLTNIMLEAKVGDVHYVRLEWTDKQNKKIYSMVSLGDALILSLLTKTKMSIIKNVIPLMNEYDENWPYEVEIIDFESNDD